MVNEWVVFNDPDDDKYVEEEPLALLYLNEEILDEYFVFRNIANGDARQFKELYYHTSRLDMFKIYAMNLTYIKERNKTAK
jgi:hypothetical protein